MRIAARRDFRSRALEEMHKLRTKVFKGSLGSEVPIMSGMKIDGYNALDLWQVNSFAGMATECLCLRRRPRSKSSAQRMRSACGRRLWQGPVLAVNEAGGPGVNHEIAD